MTALEWVDSNADGLRRWAWELNDNGAIRCLVIGVGYCCPMSAISPGGARRVGSTEAMADLHEVSDDVASDITEAADGFENAPKKVRAALLEVTGLREREEAPA